MTAEDLAFMKGEVTSLGTPRQVRASRLHPPALVKLDRILRVLTQTVFLIAAGVIAQRAGVSAVFAQRAADYAFPVNHSWTNGVIDIQQDTFPIAGKLRPNFQTSSYERTNAPTFSLFEDGMLSLTFTFPPEKKSPLPDYYFMTFHIAQSRAIRAKFSMFESYRHRLADEQVFPVHLPLGDVAPTLLSKEKGEYLRFSIQVSSNGTPKLLVQSGRRFLSDGPPDEYHLDILDEFQCTTISRFLDTLPDYTWWRQKHAVFQPPQSRNDFPFTDSPMFVSPASSASVRYKI